MSEKSIYLIDPFENVFHVFRMILEEKGFTVHTASELDQAPGSYSYSIIITEFFSPVEKVCQFIRSIKTKTPETYIIMSTSTTIDDPTYKILFEAGLDDLLVKPFGQDKLLAHIEKGIKRQELFIENTKLKKEPGYYPGDREDQPGVFGPVYFKRLLRQEIKKAKRHQQPVSLLLLKLPSKNGMDPRFGSFYLELIELLRKSLREEDFLGRENGNLGIILDNTDEAGSQNLVNRLSKLIQAHPSFQSNLSLQDIVKDLAFQYYTFPQQNGIPDFLAPLLQEIDPEITSH